MDARTLAAKTLGRVIQRKASLSDVLPASLDQVGDQDRGLLQELCYGTLRWYPQLQIYLDHLLAKPLRAKDSDIHAALLIGLYQLLHTRIPDHAAISASVEATRHLKKPWASKLVNGVLRSFQRERPTLAEKLCDHETVLTAHPPWLVEAIRTAWPQQAEAVFNANNAHPPFTLRLNVLKRPQRETYRAELETQGIESVATPFSTCGLTLKSTVGDVRQLPGFSAGEVSVQDEAAQLCGPLLQLAEGQRVLDACSAPGGKACHMLELDPDLAQLLALDIEAGRLARVAENLQRLGLSAQLVCGDAAEPQAWWDGKLFDRILLDAPCSATGVIRRHPDIKLLRSSTDIVKLAQLQETLLDALWTLLAPGGKLLYATCSIMPQENCRVIERFMASHRDAVHEPIAADWGIEQPFGRQLLPQLDGHDGFYYARLAKQPL